MTLVDYLKETGEAQGAFGLRACGVTQSAVGQWLSGGGVRAEHVLKIAAATGWRVRPFDLRPDLYPHPDDGVPRDALSSGALEKAA